jgi:RNA polymerase sigma-70 factor (ECF subfamily)
LACPSPVDLWEGALSRREDLADLKWLIARELPRLRRYALVLAGSPDAADDLVQDTLERALKKRHLWLNRGSLRSWLYRIQFNVFMNQANHRRRRAAETPLNDDREPITNGAPQESQVALRQIRDAMAQLPPEQRAAIALTAIDGLCYDEAAAALGIPLGTLRSRLFRGRQRLLELCAETVAPSRESPQLREVK